MLLPDAGSVEVFRAGEGVLENPALHDSASSVASEAGAQPIRGYAINGDADTVFDLPLSGAPPVASYRALRCGWHRHGSRSTQYLSSAARCGTCFSSCACVPQRGPLVTVKMTRKKGGRKEGRSEYTCQPPRA